MYPQFKKDLEKQVMPPIDIDNVCYALCSCLSKEPTEIVKSVEDDAEEIYPAKVAVVIIDAILKLRTIKEGEKSLNSST